MVSSTLKRLPGVSSTSRWFGLGMPLATVPFWLVQLPAAPMLLMVAYGLHASADVTMCDWL